MNFDENAYAALLERIYAITPSVQTSGFTPQAYKPGLDGMKAFDARLSHPWKKYRTVHVAGTNGKGSVASMIASALAAGGGPVTKVGLYTSPHLVDFRERMKIITDKGWIMPEKEEVWEFFQSYDTGGLSFFEMTTGLAFWWFARRGADWAVIETGLGGRLDSTNIITPELSVITSIGLDHCALLGNTRAEIAAEKAGIFKPGVPAVVAMEDPETAQVFREAAGAAGCPLVFADSKDSLICEDAVLPLMDLRGPCQKQNLHTALVALHTLGCETALPLSAITDTARRTGLRGRWEKLQESPEVICDIGHNPPALEVNFARLRDISQNESNPRPLVIVYGIMADKDLAGIAPLMPAGADYILAAPAIPRAMPAAQLQEMLSSLRPDIRTRTAGSVAAAVETALAGASPETFVYIGGSTFVVTEAIEYFNTRQK